jgi:hypothetical protein
VNRTHGSYSADKKEFRRHKSACGGGRGERFADFIACLEHRERVQCEADGNAGRGTSQKVSRTGQYGEDGGVSFRVAFLDRWEEGRGGHEATDLTQAGKVQRNARDVAGNRVFNNKTRIQPVNFNVQYRINVADVPRQRPSTPEEETIDRAVERMAPA